MIGDDFTHQLPDTFPDETVETWVAWDLPNVYADRPEARSWRFLDGIGRLAPGTTVEQAEEALDVVAAELEERYPELDRVAIPASGEPISFRVLAVRPGRGFPLVHADTGEVLGVLNVAGPHTADEEAM